MSAPHAMLTGQELHTAPLVKPAPQIASSMMLRNIPALVRERIAALEPDAFDLVPWIAMSFGCDINDWDLQRTLVVMQKAGEIAWQDGFVISAPVIADQWMPLKVRVDALFNDLPGDGWLPYPVIIERLADAKEVNIRAAVAVLGNDRRIAAETPGGDAAWPQMRFRRTTATT